MRAAIFTGTGEDLEIQNVEPAAPGPRDVVVQLGASGVCHSDLSIKNGFVPMMPGMVLGHEGAGTVLEVGAEVTSVKKGDKVIASFIPACGICIPCLADQSHLCDSEFEVMMATRGTRSDGNPYTTMTGLGTFAEAMTVSQSSVVKVETDIPFDQLALIGCGVTTGVGAALNTARVHPGATVAIIGCGGVGLSVLQGARIAGASRIIAIDQGEEKRAVSTAQGATDYVDALQGDPVAQVQALTSGRGVDYVFEVTVGTPEALTQAYGMTRKGGTMVMVSMPRMEGQFAISTFDLFYSEKTIKGCKYGSSP